MTIDITAHTVHLKHYHHYILIELSPDFADIELKTTLPSSLDIIETLEAAKEYFESQNLPQDDESTN